MNNFEFEEKLYLEGCKYIAGCDEVGRGCIAGPVYACCVIMKPTSKIEGVNDSKKLTDKKRRELLPKILQDAVCYKVIAIDNDEIDKINILEASRKAMELALEGLEVKPDYVLTDAMKLHTAIPYQDIIKGDLRSYTIGCASIIAKVFRDDYMIALSKEFPGYDWDKNKGYPTKRHKQSLYELGVTKYHRKSYDPVRICLEKSNL